MAQLTDLNVSPYYDDFNKNDNFQKVLFRPGFAVQARELTTLQSILTDQIESHGKFVKKQDLAISLLSDENGSVCEDFGVWKEKSMYGKTYMGIERSTFIIDGKGLVIKEWRKVKVAEHVKEVLQVIDKL